jgi:hypothetical protein
MDPKKVRLVTDPVEKLKFQQDSAMTMVRELFFLREKRGTIPYPKFQVGDEVKFGTVPYVVIAADEESITIKDPKNNVKTVDPQALQAGPRSHWSAQDPSQFRTACFTFSDGDWAYRPLRNTDFPPTNKAKGVLCIIRHYDGQNTVNVIDAWAGTASAVDPTDLVKPPLIYRRAFDHSVFHTFKRRVTKNHNAEPDKLCHSVDTEELCWGYAMTLDFPKKVMTAKLPKRLPEEEEIQQTRVDDPPPKSVDNMSETFYWMLGVVLSLVLIL